MPPSKREPGDGTGAGEGLGLDGRARASYLRLQNPRFFSFVVCSARSRKAIRRDSKWWTTSPSSQDAEGELLRANRDVGAEEGIPDRVQAVAFTGGGGSDLDPSVIAQAVLRRRKRDPAGDGMSEVMSCTERDHERQRHRVQPERGSRG